MFASISFMLELFYILNTLNTVKKLKQTFQKKNLKEQIEKNKDDNMSRNES